MRIGLGYDIHRLEKGKPFILGAVTIPFEKGCVGHSDGDCLLHAITDALLGALSLGDIGQHFPDTLEENRGKDSRYFLKGACAMVQKRGFQIENIDATIICQAPKLAEFIPAMRRQIASCLGVDSEKISVKAKTNEKLDSLGREEGVACHAIVLLDMLNVSSSL